MTVYVETDFLLALAKDEDWLKQPAEETLEERDVVTSPHAYLELLLVHERHEYDYVRLFANLLELVPVEDQVDRQKVLKAVSYYDEGLTPFDAFHAATAETHGHPILSSDGAYEAVDAQHHALEPDDS